MRQGVFDSDVFVLFLTNSVLSRTYCLKEISWAIEFRKPIVILVEEEARFFEWKYDRWKADVCTRKAGSIEWMHSEWLQNTFEEVSKNYPEVRKLIKRAHHDGVMIPYRRREFEAIAMARELVHQASTGRYIVLASHEVPRTNTAPAPEENTRAHVNWGFGATANNGGESCKPRGSSSGLHHC